MGTEFITALIVALAKAVPEIIKGLKDPEYAKSITLADLSVKPATEYFQDAGFTDEQISQILNNKKPAG